MNTSHHDKARAHLEASLAARAALDEIYETRREVRPAVIAELNARIRVGMKAAQVEALLAIAERLDRLVGLDAAHLDRIAAGQA